MEHSSATVSRQTNGIGDLPDEVFVLILMLLPFSDQMRVRRVSTYWRTAVHYLFRKQETVRIALKEKKKNEPELREWELESLGFNFDYGVNIQITHPPGNSHAFDIPECPVKKQVVTRFCSAVEFAIQHFDEIRVAEISWGFQREGYPAEEVVYKNCIASHYRPKDRDLMTGVCNRFASRFQNQLLCFVCSMFDLTSDYYFPFMKHLTLFSISQDIRDMFKTVTPKLVSLLKETILDTEEYLHADNLKNLPDDFRCLSLPLADQPHVDDIVYRRLRRCRTTIQSIRLAGMIRGQEKHDIHFPNLRLLQLAIDDWDNRKNILTRNAAGLQHLQLLFSRRSSTLFPSHVMFHNLQSLNIACDNDFLLDILSRTNHRLKQLFVGYCRSNRRDFFTRLSDLIRFLTILVMEDI